MHFPCPDLELYIFFTKEIICKVFGAEEYNSPLAQVEINLLCVRGVGEDHMDDLKSELDPKSFRRKPFVARPGSGLCDLAYIATTVLYFCLCLGYTDICWPSQPKIQNCGGNVG